jgi:hypothetical protein
VISTDRLLLLAFAVTQAVLTPELWTSILNTPVSHVVQRSWPELQTFDQARANQPRTPALLAPIGFVLQNLQMPVRIAGTLTGALYLLKPLGLPDRLRQLGLFCTFACQMYWAVSAHIAYSFFLIGWKRNALIVAIAGPRYAPTLKIRRIVGRVGNPPPIGNRRHLLGALTIFFAAVIYVAGNDVLLLHGTSAGPAPWYTLPPLPSIIGSALTGLHRKPRFARPIAVGFVLLSACICIVTGLAITLTAKLC